MLKTKRIDQRRRRHGNTPALSALLGKTCRNQACLVELLETQVFLTKGAAGAMGVGAVWQHPQ